MATRWNCSKRFCGINVSGLYLVLHTSLLQNLDAVARACVRVVVGVGASLRDLSSDPAKKRRCGTRGVAGRSIPIPGGMARLSSCSPAQQQPWPGTALHRRTHPQVHTTHVPLIRAGGQRRAYRGWGWPAGSACRGSAARRARCARPAQQRNSAPHTAARGAWYGQRQGWRALQQHAPGGSAAQGHGAWGRGRGNR